jgi:hypothetical protein
MNEINTKKCKKCNKEKPFSEFSPAKNGIFGLYSTCKQCKREQNKVYKAENREKTLAQQILQNQKQKLKPKEYVYFKNCDGEYSCGKNKHRDEFTEDGITRTGLSNMCKSCQSALRKGKTEEEKEKDRAYARAYHAANPEMGRNACSRWQKNKVATDPVYKLMKNTVTAIYNNIQKNITGEEQFPSKLGHAIFDYLPYTAEELVKHIESLWEPWMNWGNHGKYRANEDTWQIDHIIPQSKLKFKDFNDPNFHTLWALKNLQPLETMANIKKGNKILIISNDDNIDGFEDFIFIEV